MTTPAPVALRDPVHRVSAKAPAVWAIGAVVTALVPLLAAVVLAGSGVPVPAWAWSVYAVVAAAYVVAMPLVRFRVHRWEATETAVYTQTGWLGRERRIAPMSRVQTVDLEQGPLERLVGLASVTATTASAAGPLRISGLDLAVALRLVEDLTRRAEAERGDAT